MWSFVIRKIVICVWGLKKKNEHYKTILLIFFLGALTTSCNQPHGCPDLECPMGFETDDQNCTICKCKFQCPEANCPILCENGYKADPMGCRLCECQKPRCPKFNCSKVCIDGYLEVLGCPYCECKVIPCPELTCPYCPTGYQKNIRRCQTCECIQVCPSYQCRQLCANAKKNEFLIKACGCKCLT